MFSYLAEVENSFQVILKPNILILMRCHVILQKAKWMEHLVVRNSPPMALPSVPVYSVHLVHISALIKKKSRLR